MIDLRIIITETQTRIRIIDSFPQISFTLLTRLQRSVTPACSLLSWRVTDNRCSWVTISLWIATYVSFQNSSQLQLETWLIRMVRLNQNIRLKGLKG